MNSHEEELQKNIEAGQPLPAEDPDVKSYRAVFKALGAQHDFEVSPGFSDRVLRRLAEKRKKDASRDILWLSIGIFLLLVSFMVALMLTGFKLQLGFLRNMAPYGGLFVFGVFFILLLQWLDRRLLKLENFRGT
jgi:hypothetical protein